MVESLHVVGQKGLSIDEMNLLCKETFSNTKKKMIYYNWTHPRFYSHEMIAFHGGKKNLHKIPTIQG